jgi:hypothetical protein
MPAANPTPSTFERRFSPTIALTIICCAGIYLFLFLSNDESNILVFLANVSTSALGDLSSEHDLTLREELCLT